MTSIWYVYLDEIGQWLEDPEHGSGSDNWQDAREFFAESEAQAAAERFGGVVFVFGWVE